MEAQQFYQEEVFSFSMPARTDKPFETSEAIKEKIKVKIQSHFLERTSRPSFMSHLTYSETSSELTTVIGQLYADGEPEENQLDGELLYSSDYKATDDPAQPPSQFLPRPNLDEKLDRAPETTHLKHRLNASTSADLRSSSYRIHSTFQIGEMTNTEVSLAEDQEEEDNEDIFTELPASGMVLESLHKTYMPQTKQSRYDHISNIGVFPVIDGSDPKEKKQEDHKINLWVRQHDFML
ncbi:uncharacterized protein LOC133386113 [Rhineura floridana]|uniref:uncharacterized protein LOC133386113 n=1 Tax=Rhineura floridana TaxID=261503 RepID=UPI002AC88E9F|nr:uncharacterized protein LOC133386113 [Rhineura floridana]